MNPFKQTKFGKDGNCISACLGFLLGIPVVFLPNFVRYGNSKGFEIANYWLKPRGLYIKKVSNKNQKYKGCYMVSGISNRGFNHMVIYRDGSPFFDPHPSNTFLSGKPRYFYLLKSV